MARKDVLKAQLLDDQSLAADFTSPPTIVTFLDNCSYQINITTSNSTGTFLIEGSDDYQPTNTGLPINAGNWVTLPLGGPTTNPIANAANDSILINLNQLPFSAIRLRYVSTIAGTGTCDIFLTNKQIGG